jgi:hypothetical protein
MTMLRIPAAVILAIAIGLPHSALGQFGGLLKKAQEKVEEQVQETAEARLERAMDDAIRSAVEGLADDLESRIAGLVMSNLPPEPAELGEIETGEADASQVSYRTVSRLRMSGGSERSGNLLERFGIVEERAYVGTNKRRTDAGEESEIMDAEGARTVQIDHEDRTYWVMTFEEMMKPTEVMMTQMSEQMEEVERSSEYQEMSDRPAGSVRDMKVEVKKTGKSRKIRGAEASQSVVIVEGEYVTTAYDEDGNPVQTDGKFYTVVDQWHSAGISGYETMKGCERALAEALGAAFSGSSFSKFAESFQSAPYMQESANEALSKMEEPEGLALESTVYFVSAPTETKLNLDAVLEGKGFAGEEVKGAPGQSTLMSIVTEIGDLTSSPFDDALLGPPSDGYTEIASPLEMMNQSIEEAGQSGD